MSSSKAAGSPSRHRRARRSSGSGGVITRGVGEPGKRFIRRGTAEKRLSVQHDEAAVWARGGGGEAPHGEGRCGARRALRPGGVEELPCDGAAPRPAGL